MRYRRLCASLTSAVLAFSLLPAQGLAEAMGEAGPPTGGQSLAGEQLVEQAGNGTNEVSPSLVDQPETGVHAAMLSYRLNAQTGDDPWTTVSSTQQAPEVASDAQPVSKFELRLKEGADGAAKLRTRAADVQWSAEWPDESAAAAISAQGSFEELQLALTGNLAQTHDVWYRVHAGVQGWLGWAKNGASAGTKGFDASVDDLQIVVLDKDSRPEDFNEQTAAFAERSELVNKGDEPASGDADPKTNPTPKADESTGQDTSANPGVENPVPADPAAETPVSVSSNDKTSPAQPAPEQKSASEQAPTSEQKPTPSQAPASDQKSVSAKCPSSAAADLADAALVAQAEKQPPTVRYDAHVQNIGWQSAVTNGAVAGTSGQGLRVEAMHISLDSGADGGITYRTHVLNVGWQGWVKDGQLTGTSGRALRLEAVEIKLTGNVARDYDVWYRGHVQNIGWQGWVRNGATAGTSGQGLRVEALQIVLMPKGAGSPSAAGTQTVAGKDASVHASVSYRGHVNGMGWQGWMANGEVAGTTGLSTPLTGFAAQLVGLDNQELHYSAHVQDVGWDKEVAGGQQVGYPEKGRRVEAIKMRLSGSAEKNYDIYYRMHVSNIGWMGWAKNGAAAGTQGLSGCVEAIQVMLVAKGGGAPANNGDRTQAFIETPNFQIRGHVENVGWQGWVGNGDVCGTTGRGLRVEGLQAKVSSSVSGEVQMRGHVQNIGWQGWADSCGTTGQGLRGEALQMKFTGDLANVFDIYYRVHAQNFGWMGWAKNGENAGTSGMSTAPTSASWGTRTRLVSIR